MYFKFKHVVKLYSFDDFYYHQVLTYLTALLLIS